MLRAKLEIALLRVLEKLLPERWVDKLISWLVGLEYRLLIGDGGDC